MRHPHADPDQAPLTACTGRVSHDRTIESQLRIGPYSFVLVRDGKRNERAAVRNPPATGVQSPNELTSEKCLSSPRATRCVHEASRRPAGQPRERHGARAPPREAFSL
jgi:hypothetical protein